VHAESLAGVKFQQRNAFEHFAFCLFENLAFFAGQSAGNLIRALPGDIRRAPDHPPTLRTRSPFPIAKRGLCALDGALNILRRCAGKLRQHVVRICGVDVAHQPVGARVNPLTVDVGACMHGLPPKKSCYDPSEALH